MVAVGDEDLLTEDPIVVTTKFGARADGRQIRARLRLGQIHRAGPFAAHELWQIDLAQLLRARERNGLDRTARQQRAQHERCIGAAADLLDRGAERQWHALAADFRGDAQLRPAAVGVLACTPRQSPWPCARLAVSSARPPDHPSCSMGRAPRRQSARPRSSTDSARSVENSLKRGNCASPGRRPVR